ncbi:cysteine-rich receptor-like protein kinase 17 [Corylus avellana]|uniref:cysteine-rich receptor-like protein kinase 17 n=1 Tax=Corylus avellana TaxID=13451 RepID=UPI00286D0ADF|nr:cysteine-rich receptor-like protein kinase 17 [Corylus avellana]
MAAVVSSRLVFLSAICTLIAPAIANRPTFLRQNCSDKQGNYTSDSSYMGNLNLVLSILSNNTEIEFGFYFSYYGKNHDKVYAIGLCRGDFKPDVCPNCLDVAKDYLTLQCCLSQKEAIGRLRGRAAAGGSRCKFAIGNAPGQNFQAINALVQCTPELSEQDCNYCLSLAFENYWNCCAGRIGGRTLRPSRNFRYEIYGFYHPAADAPSPSPSPSPPPLPPPPPPPSPPPPPGEKSVENLQLRSL